MRKIFLLFSLSLLALACTQPGNHTDVEACCSSAVKDTLFTQGLRYCEGTTCYNGTLLISNFGGSDLNPLNTEGKGYIAQLIGDTISLLIPADGTLSAPKGMVTKDSLLYIADVNRLVVYNLNNLSQKPHVVPFPPAESYVNDVVFIGDTLYISVTNTGHIFRYFPTTDGLTVFATVPGANGLAVADNTLYVASYAPDNQATAANVIYRITNFTTPNPTPLEMDARLYDGVAVRDSILYYSDWTTQSVSALNTHTGRSKRLTQLPIVGAADITYCHGVLYIPDLVNSTLTRFNLD